MNTEESKVIKIYNYTSDSCEFIGVSDGYIDAETPLLPFCTDIEPPKNKNGYAIVFDVESNQWQHKIDHRGKIAYSTKTKQAVNIDFIGELTESLTWMEPVTEFDVWNGKKWVMDIEAQKISFITQAEYEKAQRLEEAEQRISMLERKVKLGMATDDEKDLLVAWEIYSVKVENTDTSLAPDINFPAKPE